MERLGEEAEESAKPHWYTPSEARSLRHLLSSREHLLFRLAPGVGAPVVASCGPFYAERRLRPVPYGVYGIYAAAEEEEEHLKLAVAFLDLVKRCEMVFFSP